MVVLSHPGDGVIWIHTAEHRQQRHGRTGATDPAAAGDLHALKLRTPMSLAQRTHSVICGVGQAEVAPPDPPVLEVLDGRVLAQQIDSELWRQHVLAPTAESRAPDAPAVREIHDSIDVFPGTHTPTVVRKVRHLSRWLNLNLQDAWLLCEPVEQRRIWS